MKKILFIFALLLVSGGAVLAETPYFTVKAIEITETSVKLTGDVPDENHNGTVIGPYYYFEYGTTSSVNSSTDNLTMTDEGAYIVINDLEPGTTYYYRFVKKVGNTNSPGFIYNRSDIKSFKTLNENDGLTEAQIDGLEDLGFTQAQINMIINLFAMEDGSEVDSVCYYGHSMTLRRGMMGEKVEALQLALGLYADGKFGTITEEKVKIFQAQRGLTPDGIVGRMTGEKIALVCPAR